MRRVHKLKHRWHRKCAPGEQVKLNKFGVCPQSLYKECSSYHFTFIAERGELSGWRATFITW